MIQAKIESFKGRRWITYTEKTEVASELINVFE